MPTDRGGGEEPREGGVRPIKPRRPGAERGRGGASSRGTGHPEAAPTEVQEPRWAALQGQREPGGGLGLWARSDLGRAAPGCAQQSGGTGGREGRRIGELRRDPAGLERGA